MAAGHTTSGGDGTGSGWLATRGGSSTARRGVLLATLLAALLAVAMVLAVTGAAQSNTRLRGEVTYQNGTAVANADVDIIDLDDGDAVEYTATTDDTGQFGPDSPPPGNYTARVDKPGFDEFASQVELNSGEAEKIEVILDEVTGNVSGTVTDRNDDPVPGLEVAIRNLDTGTVERTVVTDVDGEYGPVEVPANSDYTATVEDDGWESTAPQVTLDPGESEQVNVDAERTTGTVSVTATDDDGDAIDGVAVEVLNADSGAVVATKDTARDGTTDDVTLEPGRYTARIADDGYSSSATTVQLAAGGSETIDLTGTPTTSTLEGTVTNATGAAVAGATVTVRNASTGATAGTLTTDDTGSWGGVGVSPGRWTVTATATDYNESTATVTVAAGDTAAVPLTLGPAGAIRIRNTESTLADGTLTVSVTLENEAGTERGETYRLDVDGDTRAERTVTLADGETRTVNLETDLTTDADSYSVTVSGGGESVTSTVVTDAPTATATPTATPSPTDTATTTATTESDGASVGPLGAVLALVAVLVGRRRRSG